MGQQQLLLIVLGVIIVGVAIVGGSLYFSAFSVDAKRNNIINECVNLAALAHQFYRRPAEYGGGGRTFTGWKIPRELKSTANGTYTIKTIEPQKVIVEAIGTEKVTGTEELKVTIDILPDTYQVTHN